MREVVFFVVLSVLLFNGAQAARLGLFKASVTITDQDLTTSANHRTYNATIYYRDDKELSSPPNNPPRERMRTDVYLASSGQTLSFLEIYEDIWARYTVCSGSCNYEDIFPDELPRLWVDPLDLSRVDTGSSYKWVFNHTDGSSFVTLFTDKTTYEPISADILLTIASADGSTKSTLKRSITFNSVNFSSSAVPASTLNIPVNCPTINHGCSRLDLLIVLDNTGSIGNGWYDELSFAQNLIENFFLSEQLVKIGILKFRTAAFTVYPLTSSKDLLLQALALQNTSAQGGFGQTSQLSALAAALDMFTTYGRPHTSRAILMVSDGVGNRPCTGSPNSDYAGPPCGSLAPFQPFYFQTGQLLAGCAGSLDGTGAVSGCTNTSLGAQNGACCDAVARILLQQFYASNRWKNSNNNGVPTVVYAIAVAGKDTFGDDVLIELADNKTSNIYRVTSFKDLNTLTDKIAVQLVNADCSVPTPSQCPYDCLPGGFCCGSACVCTQDCSTLDNDCQVGFCSSSDLGTGCTRTLPNDQLCNDNNACTNETCIAGSGCSTTVNVGVVFCDDHNPCTGNDTCAANGTCSGTVNDTLPCTIDVCTFSKCIAGVCKKTGSFQCPDTDLNDCISFPCVPSNGEITCPQTVLPDGANCSTGSASSDPCIVDVCVTGTCRRGRIENNSTCAAVGSGDGDGDGKTIGLAVGIPVGVILLLLLLGLIVLVLVALLFLTKDTWMPQESGGFNALKTSRSVKNNPDFHEDIHMTNLAYDKN